MTMVPPLFFVCALFFAEGIGLDRLCIAALSPRCTLFHTCRFLFLGGILITGNWVCIHYVYDPLALRFLTPLGVCASAFCLSTCSGKLSRTCTSHRAQSEWGLLYALVFYITYTALNLFEALVMWGVSCVGFLCFSTILRAIHQRITQGNGTAVEKTAALLLASMGFIALSLYGTDELWLFPIPAAGMRTRL